MTGSVECDPRVACLLAGPPSAEAQRALLVLLVELLQPTLAPRGLSTAFRCEPGLRLRRRYGICRVPAQGPALIQVRCTRDGQRDHWRRSGAIVATLVHELAHLRHRGHSRAFWRVCRALLDDAAALGAYHVERDDPTEQPQGRGRLAGSAADGLVVAARARRREHARAARELAALWPIGGWARVREGNGRLSRALVQVVVKYRTRLLVQLANGRRYLMPAALLEPAQDAAAPR